MIDEEILDKIIVVFITPERVNAWNTANSQNLTLTQARNLVKGILSLPLLLPAIKARIDLERGIRNIKHNLVDYQTEYAEANPVLQLTDEADAIITALAALNEEFNGT